MEDHRGQSPGRRRDDNRWANVQAQLATTRQAIEVLEATVTDLKDEIRTFDQSIYGSPKDKDSIHFRLKQVEQKNQELHLVVIGEANGVGGLKRMVEGMSHTLTEVSHQLQAIAESKKDRMTRLSAVIVAGITTLGLVLTNLDKIAVGVGSFVHVFHQEKLSPDKIRKDMEELKKTRGPELEKMLKDYDRDRKLYR